MKSELFFQKKNCKICHRVCYVDESFFCEKCTARATFDQHGYLISLEDPEPQHFKTKFECKSCKALKGLVNEKRWKILHAKKNCVHDWEDPELKRMGNTNWVK